MGDADSAAKAPSAAGTLAERPLSHLLVYVRLKRLTGRLMLQGENGIGGAIALWRGRIAAARTAPPTAYFGTVASAMGLVDVATVEATYRESVAKRRLHGEVLVEQGRITAAQRDAVLEEQTCQKVHHLLSLPSTTRFAFYEMPATVVEPAVALDPITPLWRLIRDGGATVEARAVLASLATSAIKVVNEAPLSRAGFTAIERSLCEALAGRPMTLVQLRSAFPTIAPEHVDRIVYLLLLTKAADITIAVVETSPPIRRGGSMDADALAEALKASRRPATIPSIPPPTTVLRNSVAPAIPSAPSRPAGRMSSGPPARLASGSMASPMISTSPSRPPGEVAPARAPGPLEVGAAGITKRAESADDEDPFETLGVASNAPPEEARAAYFQLVKAWHPDRLPAELEPVRAEVAKIFAQMTQAHHTLTDTEARLAFTTARATRAAALHRPRKDAIRLIETALSKKDFEFAADQSRKLATEDPHDAEALALVVWSTSSAGDGPEASVRAAITALDHALRSDPACSRGFYYRAVLHKRLGDGVSAHRDFARAVTLDPKNVDATRELRIYEMRAKR